MVRNNDHPERSGHAGQSRRTGSGSARPAGRGRRGAASNPANRFERLSLEVLPLDGGACVDPDDRPGSPGGAPIAVDAWQNPAGRTVQTAVYPDRSRSVINRVDSPDLPFHWTINPYRGCEHGCIYCYARPTHETLGMSSGLDFETKIMAKTEAPALLRKELAHPKWAGQPIVMSGVTDAWQPVESQLGITRGCLEVMAEARQPVSIVTKSRLILRDLDLLAELAKHDAVRVAVSLTTLDNALASKLEPRAASPRNRLWAIQRLAAAGVPVGVMVAPVIPAITDREVPKLLRAAADAGARWAGYVLLRLPHQNKQLFDDWLAEHYPQRREHVLSLIRQTRGGKLYDATFSNRMQGSGPYAQQLHMTFAMFARRVKLHETPAPMTGAAFRRPDAREQLALFA